MSKEKIKAVIVKGVVAELLALCMSLFGAYRMELLFEDFAGYQALNENIQGIAQEMGNYWPFFLGIAIVTVVIILKDILFRKGKTK